MSLEEIVKTVVTSVVSAGPFLAVFAAIRPELEKSTQLLFRRGKVTVEKTDTIQLGFNLNGPFVIISGSILPEQQSCILTKLELEVSRDGWTKHFTWKSVYSPSLNNPFGSNEELASMIRLPKDEVTPFRIGLIDKEKADELKSIYSDFRVKYRNKFTDERNKIRRSLSTEPISIDELSAIAFSNVLQETESSEEFRGIMKIFHSEMYWKSGEYALVLKGKTNRNSQNFEKKYRIKLHEFEARTLETNYLPIRDELLDLPEKRGFQIIEASYVDIQEIFLAKTQ